MNSRIFAAVSFIATLGIFFGYIRPTWSGPIAETQENIAADNKALASASLFAEQQEKLAKVRGSISQENLDRLTRALPDSVNNIGMIIDLSTLASRSGLSITAVEIASDSAKGAGQSDSASVPTGETSAYRSLDLSLSAIGSYASLKTFLENLEKSQRILEVQDLTVKGSDTGVYGYALRIRVYWLHS